MEYQEVMLENLYQYMVEHGLVVVRLDGFTLYRNVSSIVRQLLLEFREQLLSLTRRWPVSHTSVV